MTTPNEFRAESERIPVASIEVALEPSPRHDKDGPKAPSMTSGRGWPSALRDHHQAVSASVMDGGFAASDGGVR